MVGNLYFENFVALHFCSEEMPVNLVCLTHLRHLGAAQSLRVVAVVALSRTNNSDKNNKKQNN